jgi:hypothetical protein
MHRQLLKCQKYYVDDPADSYWRVVIEETDLIGLVPKAWRGCDITHHDTEAIANEWLRTQWNLISPPPVGVELEFCKLAISPLD